MSTEHFSRLKCIKNIKRKMNKKNLISDFIYEIKSRENSEYQ